MSKNSMDREQLFSALLSYLTKDCLTHEDLSGQIADVGEVARICQQSLINLMVQHEGMSPVGDQVDEKLLDKIVEISNGLENSVNSKP